MVPRTRLLLSLLCGVGCKAESLGVEVRQGGLESLSVEDLHRDAWMFSNDLTDRGPGGGDEEMAAERLKQRLQEMKTLPGFGRAYTSRKGSGPWRSCARKEGADPDAIVWAALDRGQGAMAGSIPRAILVSLAKAWDTYDAPPRALVFCGLAEEGGLDDYLDSPAQPLAQTRRIVTFGPMGDGELVRTDTERRGIRLTHFTTADERIGTDEDRIEAVDYRELLEHVKVLYAAGLEDSE